MNKDNCVIFKATNKGISIILSDSFDFEDIKEVLIKKMEATSKFFNGVTKNIILKGKKLTEEQETDIINIICDKTNMIISFLVSDESEKELSLSRDISSCSLTKYHKGSVRSGQVIEFDGSITVMGDINPGAVVRATGNIIVLGQLKGIAHAGFKGYEQAFISAMYMSPVQLRIADLITVFPEENKNNKKVAKLAYVQENKIYVRSLY